MDLLLLYPRGICFYLFCVTPLRELGRWRCAYQLRNCIKKKDTWTYVVIGNATVHIGHNSSIQCSPYTYLQYGNLVRQTQQPHASSYFHNKKFILVVQRPAFPKHGK